MWTVREKGDLWRDFPFELCMQTENEYQNNPRNRDVLYWWPPQNMNGTHYQIDFVAMMQTNLKTSYQREIRRTTITEALEEAVPPPSTAGPHGHHPRGPFKQQCSSTNMADHHP